MSGRRDYTGSGSSLPDGTGFSRWTKDSNIAVGTLQVLPRRFLEKKAPGDRLRPRRRNGDASRTGTRSAGFYLPGMDKRQLFKTVILDGALPRKTFSMGEAWRSGFISKRGGWRPLTPAGLAAGRATKGRGYNGSGSYRIIGLFGRSRHFLDLGAFMIKKAGAATPHLGALAGRPSSRLMPGKDRHRQGRRSGRKPQTRGRRFR